MKPQGATYRGYSIYYDPKPGPGCHWSFVHKDFGGEGDNRSGCANSFAEAVEEIDFIEDELKESV